MTDKHEAKARELAESSGLRCVNDPHGRCGACIGCDKSRRMADAIAAALRESAAEEREACAELCDPGRWIGWNGLVTNTVQTIGDAIRARGAK